MLEIKMLVFKVTHNCCDLIPQHISSLLTTVQMEIIPRVSLLNVFVFVVLSTPMCLLAFLFESSYVTCIACALPH